MNRPGPLAFAFSIAALVCLAAHAADELIDDLPARTADPAERRWRITNYLKGTPREIKETLDKGVLEFDAKCKSADADLRQVESRYTQEEQFALGELRKGPVYAAALAEVAKAQAETDAAKSAPLADRMAASTRLNKLKADVQRLERSVTSTPRLAAMRKQMVPLKDKVSKMQVGRAQSLEWRNGMIDAIANTYEMRGPVTPRKSYGVIKRVTMVRTLDDGTVLAYYRLREKVSEEKSGEGLVTLQFDVTEMPVVMRNAPAALKAAPPDRVVPLYTTWRVTKVGPSPHFEGAPDALYVEPFETDTDYLLKTVLPLPIKEPPPPATKPATTPGRG